MRRFFLNRRLWLIGLALVMVVFFFTLYQGYLHFGKTSPRWETYRQIDKDMSEAEVIELLGVPPGVHTQQSGGWCCMSLPAEDMEILTSGKYQIKEWEFDEAILRIAFDENGNVVANYSFAVFRPTWTERLWESLGLF